jgi:hypothetical protein
MIKHGIMDRIIDKEDTVKAVIHTQVYNTHEEVMLNLGTSEEEGLRKVYNGCCAKYRELPRDLQSVTLRELSTYYMKTYKQDL